MRAIGIKALRNKLREYVRLAAAGETVLVTDGDRVVAELGPPRPRRSESVGDAPLSDALGRGWLSPRTQPRGSVPPNLPVAPLDKILAGLAADRTDR